MVADKTTVMVKADTWLRLTRLKRHPREPLDEVIKRLLPPEEGDKEKEPS